MTGVPCLGDPDHKGVAAPEGRTRGNEIQQEKARRGKKGNGRRRAGATLSCPFYIDVFNANVQAFFEFEWRWDGSWASGAPEGTQVLLSEEAVVPMG